MIYDEFRAGINEYSALWAKGLKKQANKVLATFAENFRKKIRTRFYINFAAISTMKTDIPN